MEVLKTVGQFEVRNVAGSESTYPFEVWTRKGEYVSNHCTSAQAISMANILDAEDRMRFN